ncbi:MAG TPA: YidC/Oxa1 family membrane protein insertase [Candidatus Magasanikbacteria bacterium]|mgnify:FL=1|nr:YidC/Oxa1 family membrane protein insertase [Candidatus Magasanikbacteria bacterium]
MSFIWFTILYQPVFNLLVWIYNNLSQGNMGYAVIIMTVMLRICLLPLSIISERDVNRQKQVELEAAQAAKSFKNDPVAQKEEARRIIHKHRVSPWAKVVSLAIQGLMLVLIYQVFVGGMAGDRTVNVLYEHNELTGKVNLDFYGFDIGKRRDFIWAGICAVYLFVSILMAEISRKDLDKSELYFLFLFPLFIFLFLYYLPMVKALFILTSMVFSDILRILRLVFFPVKNPGEIV